MKHAKWEATHTTKRDKCGSISARTPSPVAKRTSGGLVENSKYFLRKNSPLVPSNIKLLSSHSSMRAEDSKERQEVSANMHTTTAASNRTGKGVALALVRGHGVEDEVVAEVLHLATRVHLMHRHDCRGSRRHRDDR